MTKKTLLTCLSALEGDFFQYGDVPDFAFEIRNAMKEVEEELKKYQEK